MITNMKNYAKFMYPAEKFVAARRALMLPPKEHEIKLVAFVFAECTNGLYNLNLDYLDERSKESVKKLEQLIDGTGLEDPYDEGLYIIKAKKLLRSRKQKDELCRLIDELASWFDAKSRE